MKRCIDYGVWTPEHGTLLLYTVYIEHYWSTPFHFFFHNFKKSPEEGPPCEKVGSAVGHIDILPYKMHVMDITTKRQ